MSRSISEDLVISPRMVALGQHLQHAPGKLVFALAGLVGVGIHSQCERLHLITRLGQLSAQQIRRIHLGEQFGLEIQAGRQAEVAVRRPRKTINAAMLAAAIWVQ